MAGETLPRSVLAVAEVVFTLHRTYKVSRSQVREMVSDVLSLPGLQLADKALCLQALDLYADRNISFVDAFNAAYLQVRGLNEIYSWDTDFDRIAGLRRFEPAE